MLYSRKGCCLCEGLEQNLRSLSLNELQPPLKLQVIDIDALNTSVDIRIRYDLLVPVLLIGKNDLKEMTELPRVSPRLEGERLLHWLQKVITRIAVSA